MISVTSMRCCVFCVRAHAGDRQSRASCRAPRRQTAQSVGPRASCTTHCGMRRALKQEECLPNAVDHLCEPRRGANPQCQHRGSGWAQGRSMRWPRVRTRGAALGNGVVCAERLSRRRRLQRSQRRACARPQARGGSPSVDWDAPRLVWEERSGPGQAASAECDPAGRGRR